MLVEVGLTATDALGVEGACEPDVSELCDVAVAAEQYVGGFEVQVDNPVGVQEVHALSGAQRDAPAPANTGTWGRETCVENQRCLVMIRRGANSNSMTSPAHDVGTFELQHHRACTSTLS